MFARASLLLAASLTIAHAVEKPIVYNPVDGEVSPREKATVAALGPSYSIVEIPEDSDYANPKFTAGGIPRVARTADGQFIGGEVSMGCVITEQGKVSDIVVHRSSDERLNAFSQAAAEKWLFTPATLKGKPISIVAGGDFNFETPPEEFVTQILEPTGGKIKRPKDWFYSEGGLKNSYLWTISKEDLSKEKQYRTGVRIQLIAGIKKETGKSPQEFIQEFIDQKKSRLTKSSSPANPRNNTFSPGRACKPRKALSEFSTLYSGDLTTSIWPLL